MAQVSRHDVCLVEHGPQGLRVFVLRFKARSSSFVSVSSMLSRQAATDVASSPEVLGDLYFVLVLSIAVLE